MKNKKTFSINKLVNAFQRALRILTPIADELEIDWKEPNNYDDWDVLAQGLFEGFVLTGVRSSNEWNSEALPFLVYDQRKNDYAHHSYVATLWDNKSYPLICLETVSAPFDTCLLAQIDGNGKLLGTVRALLDECKFSVVMRTTFDKVEFDVISF